jgi:hypothetical protein
MNKSLPSGRTVVKFLLWIFTIIDDQIQVLVKTRQWNLVFFGRVSEKFCRGKSKHKFHFIYGTHSFSFWRFDPIPGLDLPFLPLRGFAITLTGHITLVRTRLDEWAAGHRYCYWKHATFTRDSHSPSAIRTHNPSERTALDPRLRRRGHWDPHRVFQDESFLFKETIP